MDDKENNKENNNQNNNQNRNEDQNQKEKKSLYQIMDKRGFYIILFFCIGIIGAAALWVNNQNTENYIAENTTDYIEDDKRPEVTLVENIDKGPEEIQETGKIGQGRPKDEDVRDSRQEKEIKEEREKQEEKKRQEEAKPPSTKEEIDKDNIKKDSSEPMAMPVVGKVILPFAEDRLVYHKTLDHWSTHKGIDLRAADGAPVKAVLDGEVLEVVSDSIMGISIIIKHDDELLSIYSNLGTDAIVKVGERVTRGQTISTVGKTAASKALEGPLLHFQVFRDDKFVDPEIYLGAMAQQ